MLAAKADLSSLTYPLLASYKLDGIRALVKEGVLLSRTLKPIPNLRCQALLAKPEYEGFDGELVILGDYTPTVDRPVSKNCYRDTLSKVMTRDEDTHGLRWLVFDRHDMPGVTYSTRYQSISSMRLDHRAIYAEQELLEFETEALQLGYEGLILRGLAQTYKFGRSTVLQGGMLKLKRFTDAEARVIGFEELQRNTNPAQLDERGYTKHSHHQAGKASAGILGALIVNWNDQVLRLGTGFTQLERQTIWARKDLYINKLARFKYLEIGMKDLPRHPVFLGWRDPLDV